MNYKIDIEGMHCSGCENLIKIALNEAQFENVNVSLDKNAADFSSNNPLDSIKLTLDNIFKDLGPYKYLNLRNF